MKSYEGLLGTPRYASLNTHRGYEQSRRDDLESFAYTLIYLIRGSLPWQGLQEDMDAIFKKKKATSISRLCDGLPKELGRILSYSRKLPFTAAPDYEYVRNLLSTAADRAGSLGDMFIEWGPGSGDSELDDGLKPDAR